MPQVNARKIYDEADVLGGIAGNRLFLGILGAEAALQVRTNMPVLQRLHAVNLHRHMHYDDNLCSASVPSQSLPAQMMLDKAILLSR